jgi:glycosyltransferase involved in cell wall biosynthesis
VRILVNSHHRYPARMFPVSNGGIAGARITDSIVRGLAELGHEVLYHLFRGAARPPPDGVTLVEEIPYDDRADILHIQGPDSTEPFDSRGRPWVRTCHVDLVVRGDSREHATDNWIYVSRTLARAYGRRRYVYNGIEPEEFAYSESKDDYLLFMCCLDRAWPKGIETALAVSDASGLELKIAGSANDPEALRRVQAACAGRNVTLLGEVRGQQKAELLAGARALVFPTRVNEAFGVVLAEALISGTPVITSDRGACPELVSGDVGFVCSNLEQYLAALERVGSISPAACRAKAMAQFHYLRMAGEYVREYEVELGRAGAGVSA